MASDCYNVIKTSNVKQWLDIPPPPRVRLNYHNINVVHKALFEEHNTSDLLFYLIYFSQRTIVILW